MSTGTASRCARRAGCRSRCRSHQTRPAGVAPLVQPNPGRLQNRQAVVTPRLVGSTPAPLRWAESGMVKQFAGVTDGDRAIRCRPLVSAAFTHGWRAGGASSRHSIVSEDCLGRCRYAAGFASTGCAPLQSRKPAVAVQVARGFESTPAAQRAEMQSPWGRFVDCGDLPPATASRQRWTAGAGGRGQRDQLVDRCLEVRLDHLGCAADLADSLSIAVGRYS
jgi:hypothetical protein